MPAARREPWERRCALLPCFCRGRGAGNRCGAVSRCGPSRGEWDHHHRWWHSRDNIQPCHKDAGMVPLHHRGGARAAAGMPSRRVLGCGADTIPVLVFCNAAGRVVTGRAGGAAFCRGCSFLQGLGPPVLTLWPAGFLRFGSTSPLKPPVPGEHLQDQGRGVAPGWANSLLLTHEMRAGKTQLHLPPNALILKENLICTVASMPLSCPPCTGM